MIQHFSSLIKPPRLRPGQTVGLVAPAGYPKEAARIDAAVARIAALGFVVRPGRFLGARHGYFAGTDAERAADLNEMFADGEIAGIFTLRGGYGSSRLLPLLDYAAIRRHPKFLCGYSDITAILNTITQRTGLVTFHGPIADQPFTPYAVAELEKIAFSPKSPLSLAQPGETEPPNGVTTLVQGKARGRLVGGNLTMLTHLLGTPYMPDLGGAILFLEDVHEAVYRIDRLLTQLWLSGRLAQVAGILFGHFTEGGEAGAVSLDSVLRERCVGLGVPALRGLMIGHIADKATLPLGCLVELDADGQTLTLLEHGVR